MVLVMMTVLLGVVKRRRRSGHLLLLFGLEDGNGGPDGALGEHHLALKLPRRYHFTR